MIQKRRYFRHEDGDVHMELAQYIVVDEDSPYGREVEGEFLGRVGLSAVLVVPEPDSTTEVVTDDGRVEQSATYEPENDFWDHRTWEVMEGWEETNLRSYKAAAKKLQKANA